MKIKLKIKHLVMGALLAALIGTSLYVLPHYMQANQSANTPEAAERTALLKQLGKASGERKLALIRENLLEYKYGYAPYLFDVYFDIYAEAGGINRRIVDDPDAVLTPEDRIPLLQQYVREGAADAWLIQAAQQLTYELDKLGQREEGDKTLEAAKARTADRSYEQKQLVLIQAQRLLSRGEPTASGELLEQSGYSLTMDDSELDVRLSLLWAKVLFAEGRAPEALAAAQQGLADYGGHSAVGADNDQSAQSSGSGALGIAKRLARLEQALRTSIRLGDTASSTVTGVLKRSDGTPVSNAGIFLRNKNEAAISFAVRDERDFNQRFMDDDAYRTVTDAEGKFEFHGVMPGFYQLNLGLSFAQADGWVWPVSLYDYMEIKEGKPLNSTVTLQPLIQLESPVNGQVFTTNTIDFRWKAVPGAAYYRLIGYVPHHNGGGSFGNYIQGYFTENRASIPIDQLYSSTSNGITISPGEDKWRSIDPSLFLGFMNADARLFWSVDAYDAQDRLLTSSGGYRLSEDNVGSLPSFYLKQRTLSEADRLLLKGEPGLALAQYRKDYAADPSDTRTLRVLYNVLFTTASIKDKPQLKDDSIALLQRLVELEPNVDDAHRLMEHFYKKSDWDEYNRYYKLHAQLLGREPNPYDQSVHAVSLMRQGQTEEARAEFAHALERDPSHHFIGTALALELYAGEPLSSVLKYAERYPEFNFVKSGYSWRLMLLDLKAERSEGPDGFDKQLHQVLQKYVHGQTDSLQKWTQASSDYPAMQAFMRIVLKVW